MKTKNIIYPFLALMTIGSVCGAESSVLINHSININESEEEWVLVQNENGVSIFFSEYYVEDSKYLKIKFENSRAIEADFKWSLKQGSDIVLEESINVHLKSGDIYFYQDEKQILIKNEGSIKDFIITIKFK